MNDTLAGQPAGGASASAPANGSIDIEAFEARLTAQFDERFKGLQRVIAQKDDLLTAVTEELNQFKTAGLSEEEREQLESDKLRAENQRLMAQIELNELAGKYGDEMSSFQRLLAAPTAEEQLEIMREFRASALAAAAPSAPAATVVEDEMDIPDVDFNRPIRTVTSGQQLADGTYMTDELADRLLGSVSRQADVTQRRIRPTS